MYQLNGVPNFNYIMQLTNDGWSRYNAMQVTYRQRDWHGLNTMVNFTWSNCIDTNSVNRGGGSTVPIEENPYNPNSNQGPCDSDVRLNFNTGVVYDFPRWHAVGRFGRGLADRIRGDSSDGASLDSVAEHHCRPVRPGPGLPTARLFGSKAYLPIQ